MIEKRWTISWYIYSRNIWWKKETIALNLSKEHQTTSLLCVTHSFVQYNINDLQSIQRWLRDQWPLTIWNIRLMHWKNRRKNSSNGASYWVRRKKRKCQYKAVMSMDEFIEHVSNEYDLFKHFCPVFGHILTEWYY